ncbi:hypothetical protein V8F44DRAFT_614710 [Aspergillus fumigatus]
MATFSYIAILGTVGAPIYAGFIDETLGWRWISRKCSTIPPSRQSTYSPPNPPSSALVCGLVSPGSSPPLPLRHPHHLPGKNAWSEGVAGR